MFGPYRPQEKSTAKFFTTSGMADEFVDVPDVVTAARIYARLIQNILG
jgi:acetylornithine deacetylase/succinyl-diaminopimelate desuccinylase-like protein